MDKDQLELDSPYKIALPHNCHILFLATTKKKKKIPKPVSINYSYQTFVDFFPTQYHYWANCILKLQVKDIDANFSMTDAYKTCSPIYLDLSTDCFKGCAKYMDNVTVPEYWLIFSRTKFNSLNCLLGFSYNEQFCPSWGWSDRNPNMYSFCNFLKR